MRLTSASSKARADFAQALADIRFGEPAATAQLLERLAQTPLNAFEHGRKPNTPSPIDSMSPGRLVSLYL